jgi:hypothetical protein
VVNERFLARADLDRLIAVLAEGGRTVIGPVVRDGALGYEPIAAAADLPNGWTDVQAPGSYRLRREGERTFDVGPPAQGLKRYTFPSRAPLSVAERGSDGGATYTALARHPPRLAGLGVRA